ncbi:unnamed protein product [Microthlaspi erraticum]|uniref:Uncharacterized protein n=1 Tax=Microthlaspi erraticum TaxID=1685480 RepID=A0A6D2K2L0_9BRAS|nr:unnamed protein product [Microthlaspi erraticum]
MGSSSSSSDSASSMAHSHCSHAHFLNLLIDLFSFLFTLSLITPSSLGEPFPPLEQDCSSEYMSSASDSSCHSLSHHSPTFILDTFSHSSCFSAILLEALGFPHLSTS